MDIVELIFPYIGNYDAIAALKALALAFTSLLICRLTPKLFSKSKRTFFKRAVQRADDIDRRKVREQKLIKSSQLFIESMHWIKEHMSEKEHTPDDPIHDGESLPVKNIDTTIVEHIQSLDYSRNGFMACWLDKSTVRFYYRLCALRLAFYCDVYQHMLANSGKLESFTIDEYIANLLPKFSKLNLQSSSRPSVLWTKLEHLFHFLINPNASRVMKIFIDEMLCLNRDEPNILIRHAIELHDSWPDAKKFNVYQKRSVVDRWSANAIISNRDGGKEIRDKLTVIIDELIENSEQLVAQAKTTWLSVIVETLPSVMLETLQSKLFQTCTVFVIFLFAALFGTLPSEVRQRTEMLTAESKVREIYRNQYAKYRPIYSSVKQFDMRSWIPIKLVRSIGYDEKLENLNGEKDKLLFDMLIDEEDEDDFDGDSDNDSLSRAIADEEDDSFRNHKHNFVRNDENEEKVDNEEDDDPFKLIADGLAKNNLVVITGNPGAGKTLLTRKIAYDSSTTDRKWHNYDIVLLAEFRLTRSNDGQSIIDLALHGLDKLARLNGLESMSNACDVIRQNFKNSRILIILDGYDEAVDGQCLQLDDILDRDGHEKMLEFDLIVTRRPTRLINRREKITFLDIVGFDTREKQRKYIENHFFADTDRLAQIASVMTKIANNRVYQRMAQTPLLLTFICLVHYSQLSKGTQVELYEHVVRWFIARKLDAFPNLLADLDVGGNYVIGGANNRITTAYETQYLLENWFNFEQIKRLGYISLLRLANRKYQFDQAELARVNPGIKNINPFTKIGLIVGDRIGGGASGAIQTTLYHFSHKTLQEYFAAMFMAHWEDEWIANNVEYRKVPIVHLRATYFKECWKFFIEILLTKRETTRVSNSAKQYLRNQTQITFEIQSIDAIENVHQLKFVSTILQYCPAIAAVSIDLHKACINQSIALELPNIDTVRVRISNAIFDHGDNVNMLSIDGAHQVSVEFTECQFSSTRLFEFAKYIDNNAQKFQTITFSRNILSNNESNKLDNDMSSFQRFSGTLIITTDNRLSVFTIINLFSGADSIDIRFKKLSCNYDLLELPSKMMTNLASVTILSISGIDSSFSNYINEILDKCPAIHTLIISFVAQRIDKPIEFHFLPLKTELTVSIRNAIYSNRHQHRQLNMIRINEDASNISITFYKCRFTFARLMTFAKYVDKNWYKFTAIHFVHSLDRSINDQLDCLNWREIQFENISFEHAHEDRFSIVIKKYNLFHL